MRVGNPPEEIAPIVALFHGANFSEQSWGWALHTRTGRIDIFRSTDGFAVTTPRETFYVMRNSGGGFTTSPGRPGVRRIPPEEFYFNYKKNTRPRR